jgi:SAM-dependent methyltransferase
MTLPETSANPWAPEYADEEWRRRRDVAARYFVPWLDRVCGLKGATVLEYGCGTGPVCCAFAPVVDRHIGYDIAADAVELARGHARNHRAENVDLHVVDAEQILDAIRDHKGEVDLVLLYAVVEHMTVRERLNLIEATLEIVSPNGHIAVIETPNRLVAPDWHTSFLPFFSQLDDELALAYVDRSPRDDFREALQRAIADGPASGREALVRWGRGASYHEFEVVLGDLARFVVAGGYEAELLPERPVRREEVALGRELERVRPDLPPPFGRYWMDFVISPSGVDPREVRFVRPWTLDTTQSPGARWSKWDAVGLDAGVPLFITLPAPSNRILISVTLGEPQGQATLTAEGVDLSREVKAQAGQQVDLDFSLPEGHSKLSVALSRPGYVNFVGYEAPCAPRVLDGSTVETGSVACSPLAHITDTPNRPVPQGDAAIQLLRDPDWQMSFGERAALEGILSQLKPSLAIEIGTAEGASLARIAAHSEHVHSFDLTAPEEKAQALTNVTLHNGDSHVLLSELLAELADGGRNVDFVLVDGDHSSEGVYQDVQDLLESPAVGQTLILLHDTANEFVRAGIERVRFEAFPKVAYVELDFVPGYVFQEKSLLYEMWGGLGLVLVDAKRSAYFHGRVRQDRYFPAYDLLRDARDMMRRGRGGAEEDPVALRRELEVTRLWLDSVQGSASWRLTKPLRAAKAATKRFLPGSP